jgi:membrane protease subunit (stomatin/prohibitin family)
MEDANQPAETSPLSPVCEACGTKMREAKFCPECGKPAHTGKPRTTCAQCGRTHEGEPKFCPECGAKIVAAG